MLFIAAARLEKKSHWCSLSRSIAKTNSAIKVEFSVGCFQPQGDGKTALGTIFNTNFAAGGFGARFDYG